MRMPECVRRPTISSITLLLLATAVNAQPVVDPTDLDLDGEPGVAAPREGASNPPPNLVGAGTLMVDQSHHGGPVFTFDVSGLTNFLASQGWTIVSHPAGLITEAVLADVDVLLVPTRTGGFGSIFPFAPAEVVAVRDFLALGRGLWVFSDNVDPTGVNTLSTAFGITFLFDFVRDPSDNEGELFWPTIHVLSDHTVTSGVESFGYYLGDCLLVEPPVSVIARGDDDAYSFFCPVGTNPPTLAVVESVGRAVFAGDITPLAPPYYNTILRAEEKLLLQNIANWLLGPQPTPTTPMSWGAIKTRYEGEGRR